MLSWKLATKNVITQRQWAIKANEHVCEPLKANLEDWATKATEHLCGPPKLNLEDMNEPQKGIVWNTRKKLAKHCCTTAQCEKEKHAKG